MTKKSYLIKRVGSKLKGWQYQRILPTWRVDRRSLTRGSTRVLSALSFPKASAELERTVLYLTSIQTFSKKVIQERLEEKFTKRYHLALSCKHFMNVVWSCGRKGLRAIPPLLIMIDRVDNIAAFTCQVKRSPTIRISGLHSQEK